VVWLSGGGLGAVEWFWWRFGCCFRAGVCWPLPAGLLIGVGAPPGWGQVRAGSARMRVSASSKSCCQGQRAGIRSVHCRAVRVSRPGTGTAGGGGWPQSAWCRRGGRSGWSTCRGCALSNLAAEGVEFTLLAGGAVTSYKTFLSRMASRSSSPRFHGEPGAVSFRRPAYAVRPAQQQRRSTDADQRCGQGSRACKGHA
jgi:hypothetical protein